MIRSISRALPGVVLATALFVLALPLAAQTITPPPPAVTPASTPVGGLAGTAAGAANIRATVDARSAIIGRLAAGDAVQVIGRDAAGRWLFITAPVVGWLPVFALTLPADPLTLPVIDPDAERTPSPDAPTVTAYGLINVRAEPTITAAIVGQLNVGERAIITGRSTARNDWLRIDAAGFSGWVAYFTVRVSGSLDDLPVLGVDSAGQVVVPVDQIARALFNVRLREGPSTTAAVLRVVPFGIEVAPIARSADGAWLYFSYDGAAGWGAVDLFALADAGLDALPIFDPLALQSTPEATPPTEGA